MISLDRHRVCLGGGNLFYAYYLREKGIGMGARMPSLMSGFVMAVYVPMILYLNLTYLPKSARPGWINIVFLVLASAMYIGFAGYTVYSKVVEVLAG